MSLLRTIRPPEQATIRSRVGRTSQPFTTAAFTVLVRADAGSRPYRRRHALGESDCSLHIAGSFENKPKGRAFRRLRTMFNDVWAALVDEPMSQLHGCATRRLNLFGPEERPGTWVQGVAGANGPEP